MLDGINEEQNVDEIEPQNHSASADHERLNLNKKADLPEDMVRALRRAMKRAEELARPLTPESDDPDE